MTTFGYDHGSDGPKLPAAGVSRCPSTRRPIDLVHLARQTSGDRILEREILQLLVCHMASFERRLDGADAEERRLIAHSVRGTALNVGAFPLADAAQHLETDVGDAAAIGNLRALITETTRFAGALVA